MSRRQKHRTARASATGADRAAAAKTNGVGDRFGAWLTSLVAVLVVARYFLPAESAPLGETLWIVQFWLMSAVLWFWLAARRGDPRRSYDAFDFGVGLLVGGHVLSAVVVLLTDGDRRAALNMLWEWVGIAVATLMIRDVVQRERGQSRLLTMVVLAAMTLAGLGLWQHHVWYPSLGAKVAEFDRLQSTAPADQQSAVVREQRLEKLRSELGPLLTGDQAGESQLFRARIAASTEPIGRFALANSFAALLLVGLLLAAGQLSRATGSDTGTLAQHHPVQRGWRWWGGALLMTGTAYCFWLTKSRTALVGLLVGLVVWFVLSRRHGQWRRSLRWGAVLAVGLLIVLPVIAALSGGLDREVLTEAPKSLEYRLEYWTATGAVIRESPLLGVGPGNFRQAYLKHKLPGSSEEVLDPHNLLLDVWANGGVVALAGLLWLIALLIRQMWRAAAAAGAYSSEAKLLVDRAGTADSTPGPPRTRGASHADERSGKLIDSEHAGSRLRDAIVGVAALLVAAFVNLMSGSGFLAEAWWLAGGWCIVCLLWPAPSGLTQPVIAAAAIALLVHLMGAGGIAMPAILQTLIVLGACLMPSAARSLEQAVAVDPAQPEWSALPASLPWRPMLGAALCLCLAIACAFTATLPVSAARTQVAVAQSILADGGRPEEAIRVLQSAIEADPLSAEPWQELAVAYAAAWQRQAGSDAQSFENAVQAQREAIRLDPHAAVGWQMLGDLWWLKYQPTVAVTSAQEALEAYRQAAARYPHLATLQAKLAEAASVCGEIDLARQAAVRALQLDAVNRRGGHTDKYLPERQREQMQAIAGPDAIEL